MLLLLNAHDGVDCLKSLQSSYLTKYRSKGAYVREEETGTTPGKDTSPPENWNPSQRPGVPCLRKRGKEQSNRNPTPQKNEAPCIPQVPQNHQDLIEPFNWAFRVQLDHMNYMNYIHNKIVFTTTETTNRESCALLSPWCSCEEHQI